MEKNTHQKVFEEMTDSERKKQTTLNVVGAFQKYDFVSPVNRLVAECDYRNEQRMIPLFEPGAILDFARAEQYLVEIIYSPDVTLDLLQAGVERVRNALFGMQEIPFINTVSDSMDSLHSVRSVFDQMVDLNNEIANRIGVLDESTNREDTVSIRSALNGCSELIIQKNAQIMRLENKLADYLNI